MAQRQSRGLGTGQAVSYDTGLSGAMSNFFDTINQTNLQVYRDKKEADAKQAKALQELHGEWNDYDYTNMKAADIPVLEKMVADDREFFKGHWKDIINNDPEWSNLYNARTSAQKKFIANSIQSRKNYTDLMKTMKEPDSGYSEERMADLENAYLTGGYHWDQAESDGITKMDTIVGDPMTRIDEALSQGGEELYNIKETSYPNKAGTKQVSTSVKEWKPDEDAFSTFKTTVSAQPRLVSDMNLLYPDLEGEEQYQAYYNDYKKSRQADRRDQKVTNLSQSSNNNVSGLSGKFNYSVKTEKGSRRGLGRYFKGTPEKDIVTIGRSSGAAMTPLVANGKTGVISEIIREPNGQITVKRVLTKESPTGEYLLTNEVIEEPADATMLSHIESKYGIQDINSFIDERKGGSTSGSTTSKKGILD